MSSISPPLYGLILGGGRSSRMGVDKGMINYHGLPQCLFIANLLKTFCHHVYYSCKPGQNISSALVPLHDSFDCEGPMNGILSAFQTHPKVSWFTIPVDMPLVNANAIAFLLSHRNSSNYATCYLSTDLVSPEPLLTLWEPACYQPLLELYKNGVASPKRFLMSYPVTMVTPPSPEILLNINTNEEEERFRKSFRFPK